jgi:prevent-host-death family protein
MRETSIRDARNSLPGLIHEVEAGEPVRLTRRGKAVAVVVSEQQYQRLSAVATKERDPWQAWQQWHAQLPAGWREFSDREVRSWRIQSAGGGRRKNPWRA